MLGRAASLALVFALALTWHPAAPRAQSADRLVVITLRDQPALRVASVRPLPTAGTMTASALDVARAGRDRHIVTTAAALARPAQDQLARAVESLGGTVVYRAASMNAIAVRLPESALAVLRARPDVAAAEIDTPAVAHLDVAAGTMGVSAFWNVGYTGGTTDVAVIDTGVYTAHTAFQSRMASILPGLDASSNPRAFHDAAQLYSAGQYCDDPHSADDFGGHGTYVTGMIFAQSAQAVAPKKGISYGIEKLYNLKAGFAVCGGGGASYLSDLMAAVDWSLGQSDPPEVLNYSYGGSASSDDDAYARFWDGIVDVYGKVATISAGNSGVNANPSRGTVNSPGIAWNVLTVANAYDQNDTNRANDTISTSSSRGPTPGGRKKPDITAPGTSIALPSNLFPTGWNNVTGTSFSAPAIAGASALLMQTGVGDPRAVKAVLINTADDFGSAGWDQDFGWGYYNGTEAYANRANYLLTTMTAPGTATAMRLFERSSSKATKATLVWNRRVGYSTGGNIGSPYALNNLDLDLYSATSGVLRSSSASTIDNVEQVTTSTAEPAVIAVRSTSFPTGTSETVALAHTGGFVERSGPTPSVTISAPGAVSPSSTFTVTATVSNAGDVRGHAFAATLAVPSGYTISGAATASLGSIAPAGQASTSWQVVAPGSPSAAATMTVTAVTTSYGTQWQASAQGSVTTAAGCTYAVSPGSITLDSDGGTTDLVVTAGTGCSWTASSGAAWTVITSGSSGNGSGTVTLDVTPNPAVAARTGAASVAGQSISLVQAGTATRSYSLAEGAVTPLFDFDLAIANTELTDAPVRIRYLREGQPSLEEVRTVLAQSRVTIRVNDVSGMTDGPVSVVVDSLSGTPLVVERTMQWDKATHYGGHGGAAVDAPAQTWYFAEGSQGLFDTYLLLANPGATQASVTVTFLRESGGPVTKSVTVDAGRRRTVYAGDYSELAGHSFGMVVQSTADIIAERAMYWSSSGQFWTGGHESAGVPSLSTTWLLAEGSTGPYFDTYILVSNPGVVDGQVTLTYLLPNGTTISRQRTLAARHRLTVNIELEPDARLADTAVSTVVTSTVPVVAERAMYWPGTFATWQEAHNSMGITDTAERWGLAEGRVGMAEHYETYVLLANPGQVSSVVRATFVREGGSAVVKQFTVPPTSRFNINVSYHVPELQDERFGVLIETTDGTEIAVERAMYWDSGTTHWAGGTDTAAVRLP